MLIERVGDPHKIGSLYIPDTVRERPQKGIVVAVGSEVEDLEEGDCVLFQPWSDSQFLRVSVRDQFLASITPNTIVAKVYITNSKEPLVVPFEDRVFVRPDRVADEVLGLYVHRTKDEQLWHPIGTVFAVGKKVTELQHNDRVIYPEQAGVTLSVGVSPKLHDFEFYAFREEEILCKLSASE